MKYISIPIAIDNIGLSSCQFRVYAHLVTRTQSGIVTCVASMQEIATVCGLNIKTVRRAIQILVKRKLVTRSYKPGETVHIDLLTLIKSPLFSKAQ